jgi:tRNA(Arg) A34 adenosine deaminase TadA
MRLAIELAGLNLRHGTGGPFGAALFDAEGRVLSVGVNLVVSSACSFAHADMLAIGTAHQSLGSYDLGGPQRPACELVASTEPCAMCIGAIAWSGIRRLVCGARDADAREIGFDEGPKPDDWVGALETRGIAVIREVCREEARSVLQQYAQAGGVIYNPWRP